MSDPGLKIGDKFNPYGLGVGTVLFDWVMAIPDLSFGAKVVYCRLARHNGKNGRCHPYNDGLAAELGLSTRAIERHLKALTDAGMIRRAKRSLGGPSHTEFLVCQAFLDSVRGRKKAKSGPANPDETVGINPDESVGTVPTKLAVNPDETGGIEPPTGAPLPPSAVHSRHDKGCPKTLREDTQRRRSSSRGNSSLPGCAALESWLAAAAAAGFGNGRLGKQTRTKVMPAFAATRWTPAEAEARCAFAASHRHWRKWVWRGPLALVNRCHGDLTELENDYQAGKTTAGVEFTTAALERDHGEQ